MGPHISVSCRFPFFQSCLSLLVSSFEIWQALEPDPLLLQLTECWDDRHLCLRTQASLFGSAACTRPYLFSPSVPFLYIMSYISSEFGLIASDEH